MHADKRRSWDLCSGSAFVCVNLRLVATFLSPRGVWDGSLTSPKPAVHGCEYVRLLECGRVAQLVEQRPFKAWVAGSNPAALTSVPLDPLTRGPSPAPRDQSFQGVA